MPISDRPVVIITGAGRGIGRALSVAFAAAGYAVALNCRDNEIEGKKTLQLVKDKKAPALLIKADVADSAQVNSLFKLVMDSWGRVDVLVNNAGVVRNQLIAKMTDEEWRDVMAVNLDAPFYTTRAAFPIMRNQDGGAIINIASYVSAKGVRGAANYAAAKAGLVAFTKNAAIEGGPNNIRVNAVMPGFHVTDMNKDVWAKFEKSIREQHLLKKMPEINEAAQFVVSVAQLTSVTGQVFAFESRLL
jgi:3-oxoacyl-[acyl-carrier protein] reductase